MRISDWSSDVCSSDLAPARAAAPGPPPAPDLAAPANPRKDHRAPSLPTSVATEKRNHRLKPPATKTQQCPQRFTSSEELAKRSEEQTSEHQSLMRSAYADFCLKKQSTKTNTYKYSSNSHLCTSQS